MKKGFNQNQVVAHPETGEVITRFSKEDDKGNIKNYGRIRIDSTSLGITNGFVSLRRRTAFVTLDENALELLSDQIQDGMPYPIEGKVIVKESFVPQWDGHEPKINPVTLEYARIDGKLVYRSTEFTDNLQAEDILLASSEAEVSDFDKVELVDEGLIA